MPWQCVLASRGSNVQQDEANARDELIAAIYGAASEVLPASRPLELLSAMTRSDKAFVAHYNFEERRGAIIASFNVEPNFIDTYRDIYAAENPWLARSSYFQAEGLVWRGSDIVPNEALAQTSFFQLFMYGQVIRNTAHLVIRVRGANVIHVMLSRRSHAEEYDDAALAICRLYALHARQAIEVNGAVGTRRFVELGFETAIEELAAGVALVELPSTIRYMNETCHVLFNGPREGAAPKRWAPSGSSSGRPPVAARLPRPLVEVLAQKPVPRSCVIQRDVGDGRRPIFVEIRPYTFGNEADAQTRSGYVVVCRSADTEIEVEETALRAAFHLTASEARVCAALLAGENIFSLALRLNISPQTARTHVKHIFEKTYTTRQSELMKLLVSVARGKIAKSTASGESAPRLPQGAWPFKRPGGLSAD